jgi:hypothetical protein
MPDSNTNPPAPASAAATTVAEFQALPLEFLISAPLSGAVKAQALAAKNTLDFIEAFKKDTAQFTATTGSNGTTRTVNVNVPLLAMVPVPHLRIDSLTVNFKYEISQIVAEKKSFDGSADASLDTTGFLANFLKASIKGSVASRSSTESTLNRSGSLDITMHASEAPIPEGLARILSLLAHVVPAAESLTAPAPADPVQPVNPQKVS